LSLVSSWTRCRPLGRCPPPDTWRPSPGDRHSISQCCWIYEGPRCGPDCRPRRLARRCSGHSFSWSTSRPVGAVDFEFWSYWPSAIASNPKLLRRRMMR
jgi:hypothetical protein